MLVAEEKQFFWENGYVIHKGLFDTEEITLINQAIEADPVIFESAMKLRDNQGGIADLSIWNHPGDDIFGLVSRCNRMVDSAEFLLDGEVYHYHSKLSAKRAFSGGAWEWHQDYGYWYDNGILFPNVVSVMIALEDATEKNGCLQLLAKSHLAGRINHSIKADQKGADPVRVDALLKQLNVIYAELSPGDALFFHANTLHRSDQNRSAHTRNTLISCYNRFDNSSFREHQHPNYTPLNKVADSAIKQKGLKDLGVGRDYMPKPDVID